MGKSDKPADDGNPVNQAGALASKSAIQKLLATTPSAAGETSMAPDGPLASAGKQFGSDSPPREFGRYRIVRALGEGAMGTVYLADDTQLHRQVALKIPQLNESRDGTRLERFYREARLAATLSHPNICPIHDVGEHQGTHFISMGFVQGKPLSAFIKPEKPLAERTAASLIRKIALALQEAHAHDVIHRDLKPANIMIDQRGEPIVMDFGLARQSNSPDQIQLTHTGAILGTPAYMSPEQVQGKTGTVGAATDIYGLGVILYQLLTGRLPFEGSVVSVLAQIATQNAAPPSSHRPDLNPALEAICLKAMSREATDRYASMKDFAAALADYLRTPRPTGQETTTSEQMFAELAKLNFDALSPVDRYRQKQPKSLIGKVQRRTAVPQTLADLAGKLPRWGWVTLACSLAGLILWGVIISIQAPEGTVRIELSDPDAQINVLVDGTIEILNIDNPLKLKAGKHGITVTARDFETVTRSFTVKSGETNRLLITLVPKAGPVHQPEIANGPDPRNIEDDEPDVAQEEKPELDPTVRPANDRIRAKEPLPLDFAKYEVDLLDGIDVARDADRGNFRGVQRGEWSKDVAALLSPVGSNGSMRLPVEIPDEYVLEIDAHRVSGNDAMSVLLVRDNHEFVFVLEAYGGQKSGLEMLNGKGIAENKTGIVGQFTARDRPSRIQIVVRKDGVDVTVNGTAIVLWRGDYEQLSLPFWANFTGKRALIVSSSPSTRWRFSKITLKSAVLPEVSRLEPVKLNQLPELSKIKVGTQAGQRLVLKHQGLTFAFRWCPPGRFVMGSPQNEQGHTPDENQVDVTLSSGFWALETEVTQQMWATVMGSARNWNDGKGNNYPAYDVSYDDAIQFSQKLTGSLRQQKLLPADWRIRLPTEAEWEYMARAGSVTRFCYGDNDALFGQYAVYAANSGNSNNPVASRKPNDWGIYDAHGSVWEWCGDWYGRKLVGGTDPRGPDASSNRVCRGGHFWFPPVFCRSADRVDPLPGERSKSLGFRVNVAAAPPSAPSGGNELAAMQDLKPIGAFTRHSKTVLSVAFSTDGRYAISGDEGGSIFVWDVAAANVVQSLDGHEAAVRSVVFSKDGKQALSGSADRTVRLWTIATGKELARFDNHASPVNRVAYAADGRNVLSATQDQTVRIFDIKTRALVRTFQTTIPAVAGHVDILNSLPMGFSADGARCLVESYRGSLRLWDVENGREMGSLVHDRPAVRAFAFSQDGTRALAAGDDKTVTHWDLATLNVLHRFEGHTGQVRSVEFTPDGKRAVSGGWDGTVRVWDLYGKRELAQFSGHRGAMVWCVAVAPDGLSAISGAGWLQPGNGGQLLHWHLPELQVPDAKESEEKPKGKGRKKPAARPPAKPQKKVSNVQQEPSDRRIADSAVQTLRGAVRVSVEGFDQVVQSGGVLPKQEFRLTEIDLYLDRNLTDAHVA
ncbi:MAG: hypothetical protein EXS05_12425 [Planctomycetaceae bacterium]|nr:hypothetical protein [Planctomycetaceae bacterium]